MLYFPKLANTSGLPVFGLSTQGPWLCGMPYWSSRINLV